VPLAGNPNPGMWMYGDTLARLSRLAPGVLHADLLACNAYAGGMEAAAMLKCPVQFILGARDMMTPPRGAEELIRKIAQAKSTRIATSGHSLMAEAPDATLNALIAFL
jgi:pimeloyl-ACP methyl ester carboxylesterase